MVFKNTNTSGFVETDTDGFGITGSEDPSTIPDSGVSRYEFEQDVTDSWGGNDGMDNTSAGYVSGKVGDYAKAFDGTDDYVDVPTYPMPSGGPYSVSMWVNYQTINTGTAQVAFWFRDNQNLIFREDGSGNWSFAGMGVSTSISANTWYHVVATADSNSNGTGYVDGSQVGTGDVSGSQNQQNRFGQAYNNSQPADLYLDDVGIYDKELSSQEVSNLYNTDSI